MPKVGKSDLYEDLKREILTMELAPDQDLDEVELSLRYGISRTPVREVFHRLEGKGFIEIRANRGARVAPMDYVTVRNFFLAAPMIYAAIGRLAAQNRREVQIKELAEVQASFRAAGDVGDVGRMVMSNNRFHELIGEMSGNVYLCASLGRLLIDHARIGHLFFRPPDPEVRKRFEVSADHHDGFIAAIRDRDEDTVVNLSFEHWELSRVHMEMFIVPEAMREDERTGPVSGERKERGRAEV